MHAATPLPVQAPVHWDRDPYMACRVCTHGRTATGRPTRHTQQAATHCVCPAVASPSKPVPVADARRNSGACGPEAHHQVFPGLLP